MKNPILVGIVAAVVFAAAGFLGGMQYQKSQVSPMARQFAAGATGAGNRGLGGTRGGFSPVAGEIISADDKSISVKLQDGSSKIVILSDKTTINKTQPGAKTDLTSGVKVAVFGTTNTDGSVTATNVQINPAERRIMPTP